jgi:hypothetical protein
MIIAQMAQQAGDATPIDLLPVVKVAPTRRSGGVHMADQVEVRLDGPAKIALHQLHVVAVVQQLQRGRADLAHDRRPEFGAVALLPRVIDLAVQELEADGDSVLLGEALDPVQSDHAVLQAFLIGQPAPVSRKGDDVRDARGGGARDVFAQLALDLLVVIFAVQPVRDGPASGGN